MQLAATIGLTFLYAGLSLALGGVRPGSGFPWWFFVRCIVMAGAGLVATWIMASLPIPWADGRRYASQPRRLHLSWRAAVRLPVYGPSLLLPWHFLSILKMHVDLGGVLYLLIALVLAALALVWFKRRREIRLLREGEVASALVDHRENTSEWMDRISYHFTTRSGTVVSGRAFYTGYNVLEGAAVPVFYDPADPDSHVAACASWFEAD